MSGLDKILNVIEQQGDVNANTIIEAAEKKAQTIRINGEINAKQEYENLMKKCALELEQEYDNSCSGAEAEIKREMLSCKVKYINDTIEKALNQLSELPADEYFGIILKLVGKSMRKGNGVISFSKNDLLRMPSGFEKNLNILAGMDSSSIEISSKPAEIENGFILSYGDISENCSFRAIVEAEKENIRDKVASVLFA